MLDNLERVISYANMVIVDNKKEEKYIDYTLVDKFMLVESKDKHDYSDDEDAYLGIKLSMLDSKTYISSLSQPKKAQEITIECTLKKIRSLLTSQKEEMAFTTVEIKDESWTLIFWPRSYKKYKTLLKLQHKYQVWGKIDALKERTIIVDKIVELNV